ncbi:MAG: hypothetical protein JWN04_2115 [Myxococcaceae bacterium]|nr:hypothetical protein [Myxococcaceae bacterium]
MSDWHGLEPHALWGLMLLPWLAWVQARSRAGLSAPRRFASLALRGLTVCALALALARPVEHVRTHATSTVVLIDVSDSIDDAALEVARRYVDQLLAQPGEQHVELVTFARVPRRLALPERGRAWSIARHPDGSATDLERALSLSLGLLRGELVPQLVLFSDGRETHGTLARLLPSLLERGIRLYIETPHGAATAEVGVLELALPDTMRVGEPFRVTARVVASVPMRVRARLLQNSVANQPDAVRELALEAGETTLSFESVVRAAGRVLYRLELVPEGPDRFADNNQFERSVVVRGAPRVLYVERETTEAYALLDLLRAASFEVELRTPEQAPNSESELRDVDFYILSDVPAEALSRAAMTALGAYVSQGGGLLIAGGERAFGLGGYRGTALEALCAVGLETSARREQASLALILAIDKSGSMAGEKLERAKQAAVATAEQLPRDSYLGVIGFDTQPEQVVRLALAGPLDALARKVATLAASGGTAIFPALDAAYAALAGVRARVKHVVLLTDGQTEEESLSPLARSMRADGITLSTIGLGEEINRGLLSELARLGSGRAYFTRDPSKVPRLFTEETQLVSRSLAREGHVRVERAAEAAFLKGVALEQAPALGGYVSTTARAAPAQLILTSEQGEPLLARMPVGRGWSLAWTSDLKPRWAADWFSWRPLSRLVAQLVREHMRRDEPAALPIEASVHGDILHATLDVLDERARFVNGLTGSLEVTSDRRSTRSTEFFQRAPGRYEAELALPSLGTYALNARLLRSSDPSAPPWLGSGSVSYSFPAEYRPPFEPDEAALMALASRTKGGRLLPAGELQKRGGHTATRSVEHWPALAWGALLLFLLDVAVRRAPAPRRSTRQGT